MSEKIQGGYVLLARKMLESEIMDKPPLYFKLWGWMLLQAKFKEDVNLKRGQFFTSIKEMQEAMSYYVGYRKETPTKKQIRGVYESLYEASMIGTMKVTGGLLITILNYNEYQDPKNYEGHNEKNTKGTTRAHLIKEKERERKGKNVNTYSRVVDYLNRKTNSNFKPDTKKTQDLINARLREGFEPEDFKTVIDFKCDQWFTDDEKHEFLRPQTLFSNKFESYLNAAKRQNGNNNKDPEELLKKYGYSSEEQS